MTAAEALRDATARLAAAGCDGPERDARRLLAHAIGVPPGRLTLSLSVPLGAQELRAFAGAVARRVAREPVSKIVGRRAFWGRDFHVTRDVLDPRPESETLIAAALDCPARRILDLGTGSGCLLVTLLAERLLATGLGTDISSAALRVAEKNARLHGVSDRAGFSKTDWCDGVVGPFDLIVANPPYIGAADLADLAPEVRDWDPPGALSPGPDALAAYRRILAGLDQAAAPETRIFFEIGHNQGHEVAALCHASGLASVEVLTDLDGRSRVVAAQWPSDGHAAHNQPRSATLGQN